MRKHRGLLAAFAMAAIFAQSNVDWSKAKLQPISQQQFSFGRYRPGR